jgi:outer membrane protein, heavy metal efflux system
MTLFFTSDKRLQVAFAVLLPLAILLLNPLAANAAANKNAALSLAEAINKTFQNNPDLASFQFQNKAQQGRLVQAGLSPKPEVTLMLEDALGDGDLEGFDSAQTTLSVNWVLEQALRQKRTQVAMANQGLIDSDKLIKQLDVATQTARYFLQTLAHQESALLADKAIYLADAMVKETKKRTNSGKASLAELYRAEAELAQRQLIREDSKHEIDAAIRLLAAQWGETAPMFTEVAGQLTLAEKIISFEELKQQLNNNLGLHRFLSLQRIKEAELKLAEEQKDPMWRIQTGLRHDQSTGDYSLIAGLSVPFGGSNQNQGRIAEVSAQLEQQHVETTALRIRLETALFVYYKKLEHSQHVAEILSKNVIPRLEKALSESRKAYESGKYSYLELKVLQTELLDAQLNLLENSLASQLNKIEIERLTGVQITTSDQ